MNFDRVYTILHRVIHGGRADADAAIDEASRLRAKVRAEGERFAAHVAEGLRAKEQADHKAWLRDNAGSITTPEHPAVALLREWCNQWGRCPICDCDHKIGHDEGCPVAAILATSKPGERALSELLAEERARGAAEEREAILVLLRSLPVRDADGDETDLQDAAAAIRARGGAS